MSVNLKKFLGKFQALNLCLLAFAMPLPITIVNIVFSLTVITEIIYLSITKNYFKNYIKPVFKNKIFIAILFYIIIVFISAVLNKNIIEGFYSVITYKAILVFLIAFVLIRRYRKMKNLVLLAFITSASISACAGIIQQIFNIHFTSFKYLQSTGLNTIPINFAGQMQISTSITLAIVLSALQKKYLPLINNQAFAILLLIINFAGLISACERSAFIGFSLATIIFLMLSKTSKTIKALQLKILSTFVLVVSTLIFLIPNLKARLFNLIQWNNDLNVMIRIKVYLISLMIFFNHPYFGIGPRFFPALYFPQICVPGHPSYLYHAHSNILHIMATLGIFGLVFYLYLNFEILRTCTCITNKIISQNKIDTNSIFKQILSQSIILLTLSLFISGLFEYNFGTSQIRTLTMFLMGLLG